MKFIRCTISLLLCFLIICITSCGSSDEATLKVVSTDYIGLTELKSKGIDKEYIENWSNLSSNPYVDYCCHVSLSNGNVVVSNRLEAENIFSMTAGDGYFLGITQGEFDGWVKYFPNHSAWEPEFAGEPQVVVNENCCGFLKISDQLGYLFTTDMWKSGDSYLYELNFSYGSEGFEWSIEKITRFSDIPVTFTYNENEKMIYIATLKDLVAFSLESNTIEVLADLSLWEYSGATSIVQLNDKLYIGMCMGICEYDLAQKELLWYPMDYSKYVN